MIVGLNLEKSCSPQAVVRPILMDKVEIKNKFINFIV